MGQRKVHISLSNLALACGFTVNAGDRLRQRPGGEKRPSARARAADAYLQKNDD